MQTTVSTAIDAQINDLKQKSRAYKNWQKALEIRDRIYAEVGSGTSAGDRAKALIKFWSDKWQAEMNAVDPQPCDETLEMLAEAENIMKIERTKEASK